MEKNLKGVFKAVKKDNSVYYRASVTYKGKHISIGSFDNAEDANYAYQEANEILKDNSISIDKFIFYKDYYHISFEKAVTLINFRDNNMYIANPIYISKKMFYYYLSMDDVLKFDADELFFYSSHKILRRGNHLFTSDFGNQINILNRHGIRSHAVCGRDYDFKNGDKYDLRVSNIEIFNIYFGVSSCKENGRKRYKAVIHTKANYTVGHYDDPVTAAIAYNKACDIINKSGYTKVYPRNELSILKMSKTSYNDVYKKVSISDKIKNYMKTHQQND